MADIQVNLPRAFRIYKNRVNTDILDDQDYKALYRFSKENVKWLSDHFLGVSNEKRGSALTNLQKMETFLRYVADPGFQSGVANDTGIDKTTACKVIHLVRRKITSKANLWIKFPKTMEQKNRAKEIWRERFAIPAVIGAIDCTHVKIPKPKLNGDEYVNRKGFASLNIQATCDAKERFTSVCVEWPGSVHDSRILRNSSLPEMMSNLQDCILLGDSGYGITEWLMTPFKACNTPEEILYNKIYAKERVIIERLFGQLKRRFPILQYKVRTSLATIPSMILACFILHNCAKYLMDEDDFDDDYEENVDLDQANYVEEVPQRQREKGQQKRNQLANILFQNR